MEDNAPRTRSKVAISGIASCSRRLKRLLCLQEVYRQLPVVQPNRKAETVYRKTTADLATHEMRWIADPCHGKASLRRNTRDDGRLEIVDDTVPCNCGFTPSAYRKMSIPTKQTHIAGLLPFGVKARSTSSSNHMWASSTSLLAAYHGGNICLVLHFTTI